MKRINLDREWSFEFLGKGWRGDKSAAKCIVDLPHDFSIMQRRDPDTPANASNGFFPGGVAKYTKKMFISNEWKNKKLILEFEGVYMNSVVHINSQLVARHPYGYTSFHCDITPYILYDRENIISVTVNNGTLPNTRWYSGSGIYRHVWLLLGDEFYIAPWGIFVKTPTVSPDVSIVEVKTDVVYNREESGTAALRSTLLDASGNIVASNEKKMFFSSSSAQMTVQQELSVKNPELWSIENPYLYTLKSEIISEGVAVDSVDTSVGIRSISFDPEKGFHLNNVPMKLKGGCVHHDCGLLGAASYDRAEERKVELLKKNGFNAVRCAHNPPSPAFLDACDRLGLLVIDEAFDCWREGKNINDYSVFFEEWWQKDLASMILRDRNHPSIIMWSIGNEVAEKGGRSDGYSYVRKLADFVRNLDNTRPVNCAVDNLIPDPYLISQLDIPAGVDNGGEYDYFGELTREFFDALDVAGYNYLLDRYEDDGKKFPGRIIYGTETYPKDAYDYWDAVERLPYVIGDFVWTALDYLGEAGLGHVSYGKPTKKFALMEYPWHQAFCGDIDICGFKRPQSYYRDCVWGLSEKPYIAVYKPEHYGKEVFISLWGWPDVVSSWTWPGFENKPIAIDVYSTDEEVELLLNGKSIGRKPAGKPNRYIATFETVYEPGELVAIGYREGRESSRTILRTAGPPASIRLTPDRDVLSPKFGDLSFVTVELLDSNGNIAHGASDNIYFTASGVGSVIAVGSGNPASEEMYVGNQRRVWYGRAMVVVRANGEKGDIELTASAEGIPSQKVIIKVV